MRISRSSGSSRSGFTLLEVLLASVIAVLLMGGLYVAMTVELRQASEGREVIERATVARAIINRLSMDLTPSLTPPGAKPKQKSSGSSSSGAAGGMGSSGTGMTSGATGTGSSTASTTTGSSASTTTSSDATTQSTQQTTGATPLQAGVIGGTQMLIIYATRVPDSKALAMAVASGQDLSETPFPSDIRRITYWLGSNGGLCRQEIPWFSSDEVYNSTDLVLEDGRSEDSYIIAKEVVDLSFEYYDINATTDESGWVESWLGTDPALDGVTPKGPPTAIRVYFTIRTKDSNGEEATKNYSHVIVLPTSSGPDSNDDSATTDPSQDPSQQDPSTSSSTTASSSTKSSSSAGGAAMGGSAGAAMGGKGGGGGGGGGKGGGGGAGGGGGGGGGAGGGGGGRGGAGGGGAAGGGAGGGGGGRGGAGGGAGGARGGM